MRNAHTPRFGVTLPITGTVYVGGECLVIGKGLPILPASVTVNGVVLSVEQWATERGMEAWIIGGSA